MRISGKYGSVKYYCEAVIKRPWYDRNVRSESTFKLLPEVDLDNITWLLKPELHKVVTGNVGVCLYTKDRTITAEVRLSGVV